jgi:hypothetical protein
MILDTKRNTSRAWLAARPASFAAAAMIRHTRVPGRSRGWPMAKGS